MTESDTPREPAEPVTTASLAKSDAAETRTFADDTDTTREARARDAEPDVGAEPLLPSGEVSDFRSRWDSIQAGFVDEPRKAVEDADGLVAATMKRLAEVFADERDELERQWDRGEDVSTEDLRQAFRRYRTFFSRLLSV